VLSAELRRRSFGAILEARATLPGSAETAHGKVSSWSGGGVAGVCGYVSWLFGCVASLVGAVAAESHSDLGRTGTAPVVFVGPRVGLDVPLGQGPFDLRLQVDGLWSMARHRLVLGGEDIYEYPPAMLALSALFGVRL
jgi:hypothetical protein